MIMMYYLGLIELPITPARYSCCKINPNETVASKICLIASTA